MYDNYCKKSANGEIYKIDYLVVWFMDDTKLIFSPQNWHNVEYIGSKPNI